MIRKHHASISAQLELKVIAYARNGYVSKFGIPRQSGCAPSVLTKIVFEPEYRVREALRGIEQFTHLWLIWEFSAVSAQKPKAGDGADAPTQWSPTVRPPRLGGNTRMGVFATRSPFRPNSIGLSSVRLEKVEDTPSEGVVLWVSGADLMNNTPIFDIKPFVPYTDNHPDAIGGFAQGGHDYQTPVVFAEGITADIPPDMLRQLTDILAEDPRPQYHHDPNRIYALQFDKYEIKFRVEDKVYVESIDYE